MVALHSETPRGSLPVLYQFNHEMSPWAAAQAPLEEACPSTSLTTEHSENCYLRLTIAWGPSGVRHCY